MANGKTPEKADKIDNSDKPKGFSFRRPGSYSDNYKRRYDEYFVKNAKKEIRQDAKKLGEGVRREFKKLGKEGEKVLEEVEKFVVSRQARKIEKIIIAIIYIAVILVAIYFIFATFFPEYIPGANTYEIRASDSKLFNNINSFYIDDQSVLGDKKVVNDMTVRPITSSKKFNFVFEPKQNIPSDKTAEFELNLVLNKEKPGNIYVDDNLIFPDLTNYQLLAETDSDYIYVNKELVPYIGKDIINNANTKELVKLNGGDRDDGESENIPYISDRTEDFLYKNMPSASVWATRKLNPVDINVSDYKLKFTMINTTIRNNLNLAIYTEDNLNIDFTKQDLNLNVGEDSYSVKITNSAGDVIFTQFYGDDGNKLDNGKLGKEQNFNIYLDNLKNDVYYVSFTRDSNNKWEDSTLKNININSNKVLIRGTFLLWNKWEFYKKVTKPEEVKFEIYWSDEKIVNVTGSKNQEIVIDRNNQPKILKLDKGEYYFNDDSGKVWVANNYLFSQNKENWFEIPAVQQEKFNNPNLIVIDKYNFDKDTGLFGYSKDVDTSKTPLKVSLRALERNSASFKDAEISVK